MGLKMSDLFPPEEGKATARRPGHVLAEAYAYVGDGGEVLYETLRYEPKRFAVRRPAVGGGWAYNFDGMEPVLYRLPELRAAHPRMPVFFVEGERLVHALEEVGLVATSAPFGARYAWHANFGMPLCGRRVVLLPDNDEPGHAHMAKVAWGLLEAGVASLRQVILPGLPPGGDVIDWLAAGRTADDLVELCRQSPEYAAR